MDKIKESLDRLSELSPDELTALQDEILKEFEAVESQEPSKENVDKLTALADAADAVRAESSKREAEKEELAQAAQEAASRIRGEAEDSNSANDEEVVEEETSEEETETADEASNSTEEVPKEDEKVEEVVEEAQEKEKEEDDKKELSSESEAESSESTELASEEPEPEVKEASSDEEKVEEPTEEVQENSAEAPEELSSEPEKEMENTVTASANLDGLKAPEDHEVTSKSESATVAITAGADIPGVSQGSELPDTKAVATAIIDRKRAMGKTTGGDGEQHTIATFTTSFPEDRTVYSSDSAEVTNAKVREYTEAIVAAGGLCAPVDTSYDIFKLGEAGRPVKDSLPVFKADRGGLRFITAPTIEDLDGAVSLWTLEDDKAAAQTGSTKVKPCIRVACGEEVTVYVDAIPLCLTFGNLGARAWPELVERHIELGMISHDRYAETRLITRIGELSTKVTTAVELGAARDFFVALDAATAGYRSRHRLSEKFPLRVLLPAWFKSALRADIVKQLPGNGQEETFNLAEASINRWFDARGVKVTWFLDGEEGQMFGEQAAGTLDTYPENLVWYMFAEGTFLFLDGGTLDLGLVRDSQLNATNDYKIFLETFEAVAKVGVESLKVTSAIKIAGASAATVETITAP